MSGRLIARLGDRMMRSAGIAAASATDRRRRPLDAPRQSRCHPRGQTPEAQQLYGEAVMLVTPHITALMTAKLILSQN
jgi:hypothetical protein